MASANFNYSFKYFILAVQYWDLSHDYSDTINVVLNNNIY